MYILNTECYQKIMIMTEVKINFRVRELGNMFSFYYDENYL